MTIDMKKIWFVDGQIIEEQIPEEKIYWQSLTKTDIDKVWEWAQKSSPYGVTRIETFARAIEAKLKEKNNG